MRSFATVFTALALSTLLTGCDTLSRFMPFQQTASTKIALKPLQAKVNVAMVWQVKTGHQTTKDYVRVYPYVDDTAVIVAGGTSVSAWHKQTGALLWRTSVQENITGGVNGGAGLVFVGTNQGNAVALDRATGQIRWVEPLNSEVLAVSEASQGRVVFRTSDGRLSGLSLQTGEIIWQQLRATPILSLRGAGVPVLVGPLVVAGFDNGMVAAFDLVTGATAWEAILALPKGSNELEALTDVDGRLKVLGEAVFASSYNGQLAGIRAPDGQIVWSNPYSSYSGVDADGQGLYATNQNGEVWKFQPQTGQAIWKMDDLAKRGLTAPILHQHVLAVSDREGYTHWINPSDGKMVARVHSDPAGYTVAPTSDGQTLYTFGRSGILAAYRLPK